MATVQVTTGDRIIDQMIALAGCSTRHRILVAGSKSMEMMIELHRRGYVGMASTGNCGRPAGQYDVALVDWRRRSFPDLERWTGSASVFVQPRSWSSGSMPRSLPLIKPFAPHWRSAATSSSRRLCMSAARVRQRTPLKNAA